MAKKLEWSEPKPVDLSAIATSGHPMPREQLDEDTIEDYAESLENGAEFPPVKLIDTGKDAGLLIVDGNHRVRASAKAAERFAQANGDAENPYASVRARVAKGSVMMAFWEASAANATNGLRRTNADKRVAVGMALDAFPTGTNAKIAEHCGVTPQFVGQLRKEREPKDETKPGAAGGEREAGGSDAAGIDSDSKVLAAMQTAKASLEELVEPLSRTLAAVARLKQEGKDASEGDEFAAAFVNLQGVEQAIRDARTAIEKGIPAMICPWCAGDKCATCHHQGWLGKFAASQVPAEQLPEKPDPVIERDPDDVADDDGKGPPAADADEPVVKPKKEKRPPLTENPKRRRA